MSERSNAHSDSPSDSTSTLDDVSQASSRQSTSDQNSIRKVYFPEEETDLVTGYLEPPDPWQYAQKVSREELISRYKWSCHRHGTEPLARVLKQLKEVDVDGEHGEMGDGAGDMVDDVVAVRGRSEVLDLKGERLRHHHCEPLEEILKRLQFDTINLEESFEDDEASVAIFDMVEYYEAAKQLNISSNNSIGPRGWQACSQMLKKTRCLEKLVARNTKLSEQLMPTLCRGLRIGTNLQILHLENCNLSGRSVAILVSALKTNTSLKELHLADNGLGVADALHLRDLLRVNSTLQLLDVSNNSMQDKGVGHICDGLVDQAMQQGHYSTLLKDLSSISGVTSHASTGAGLSILVLWNNQLTKNSAFNFYKLIANSKTLDTLNVGRNMLTSESLLEMKEALQQSRSLERLGLQSTCVSCEGAIALAECIAINTRLQRIDLRDNPIQIGGLMALARSMKEYTGVSRLDLDDTPKRKLDGGEETLLQYVDLVREIRAYCERNAWEAEEQRRSREERRGQEVGGCVAEGGEGRGEEEEEEEEEREQSKSPVHCPLSTSSTSRKISLTCETLLKSSASELGDGQRKGGGSCLLPGGAEGWRLGGVGGGGRLRSPAPSPVPSPSPSPTPSPHSSPVPSPSRSRFHVSRVPDSAFFLAPHGSSAPPSLPTDSPDPSLSSSLPSRFKVTLVSEPRTPKSASSTTDIALVQSSPTVVTSSTSNVTIGFKFDEPPKVSSDQVVDKDAELDLKVPGTSAPGGEGSSGEEGWNFEEPVVGTKVAMRVVDEGEMTTPKSPAATLEPSPFSVTGRIRKFSSIIPPQNLEPDQQKNASSLERLLGLFQHPGSIFSKSSSNSSCTQNGSSQPSLGASCSFASPSTVAMTRPLPSTEFQTPGCSRSPPKSASFSTTGIISSVMQEVSSTIAGEYRSAFSSSSPHKSKSFSSFPSQSPSPSSQSVGKATASPASNRAFQDGRQSLSEDECHRSSGGEDRVGVVPCECWCSSVGDGPTVPSGACTESRGPSKTTSVVCGVDDDATLVPPPLPLPALRGLPTQHVDGVELLGVTPLHCRHFPDPNCNTYNEEEALDNVDAVKRNNEGREGVLWGDAGGGVVERSMVVCQDRGGRLGADGSASQTTAILAHVDRQQQD